ncbi:class II aldolase/adducin family protein [bacterium]|nr:MAG: class II aldolase/adducin family protein [bacterium]
MLDEFQIREDIVECGRRLYQKGFVAANDGNISVKISDDEILATPTGRCKGFLYTDELVKLNHKGDVLEGSAKPSTEILMHLAIYEERPDVRSVVHAHPIYATGFATANIPLSDCVLAEIVTTLGSIPIAPYATPSTPELADSIRNVIRHADACLLANHGVVTCGRNVFDAYYKMERVEHYAHIIYVAKMLGGERVLSPEEVQKLYQIRETYGTQTHANPGCLACTEDCVGGDCVLYEKKNKSHDSRNATDETRISALIRDIIQTLK